MSGYLAHTILIVLLKISRALGAPDEQLRPARISLRFDLA